MRHSKTGTYLGLSAILVLWSQFGAVAQSSESLGDTLIALAPDFEMGLQVPLMDLRQRSDTTRISETYDVFPDFEDTSFFDTEMLDYLIQENEPLTSPGLVTYSIVPDHYVVTAMKDGRVTTDPVINHYVACANSLETYVTHADVDLVNAAVLDTEDGAGLSDEDLMFAVIGVVLSITNDGPLYFEIEPNALPPRRTGLIRSCTYTANFYSQSEDLATQAGQRWLDQASAIGTQLAGSDTPENWIVVYDRFSSTETNTPPPSFRKIKFGAPAGAMNVMPGANLGGVFLQSLKVERNSEARYSDVYGAWANTVYLSVDILVPLSSESLESLQAGTYFPE